MVAVLNLATGWPLAQAQAPGHQPPALGRLEAMITRLIRHPTTLGYIFLHHRAEILSLGGSKSQASDRSVTRQIRRPRSFRWPTSAADKNICDAKISHHSFQLDRCQRQISLHHFHGQALRSGQWSRIWRSGNYLTATFLQRRALDPPFFPPPTDQINTRVALPLACYASPQCAGPT